jgi:hypothetical protein
MVSYQHRYRVAASLLLCNCIYGEIHCRTCRFVVRHLPFALPSEAGLCPGVP